MPAAARAAARRTFGWLALIAAGYTYALVVFGAIVRITGSGMGCGDDWPRCRGQWIPPFELATLIEYSHRLLAAGLVVPLAALAWYAWRQRAEPGFAGRGGLVRPVLAVLVLLVIQVLLGALTVKLELPASVTVLHFGTAMLLLGALVIATLRARAQIPAIAVHAAAAAAGATPAAHRWLRPARAAAGIGFVVILVGALTANTGAAPACQGFPLCNGQWLPAGASLVHIHWTHRLLAFLLFFHVLGCTIAAQRWGAPRSVLLGAAASLGLIVAQLAVAAGLVLLHLTESLRVLHVVIGVALWIALIGWSGAARAAAGPGSRTA